MKVWKIFCWIGVAASIYYAFATYMGWEENSNFVVGNLWLACAYVWAMEARKRQ
jgi:hypothetical protein